MSTLVAMENGICSYGSHRSQNVGGDELLQHRSQIFAASAENICSNAEGVRIKRQ
jgi:hypothetical protein